MRLPLVLTLADVWSRAAPHALDILAPRACPSTGAPLAGGGGFSAQAWRILSLIDQPLCSSCGAPFAHDEGPDAVCAACVADPPAFDAARAALVYDESSHGLITAFKHADRTDLAPLFAQLMTRAGADLLVAGALIAPTPLHPRRLFERRYNQSALLAQRIARATKGVYAPDLLVRIRATPPQASLSAAARRRNVAGAFAPARNALARIAGADIVLVDDVMTTGSTLSACARTLKKAGARTVKALALARALRSQGPLG